MIENDLAGCDREPLLSLEDALAKLRAAINPITETESIGLKAVLGRVLAQPVFCPLNIPRERNAAMDGYAFCSADLKRQPVPALVNIGCSWAGKPFQGAVQAGECVRIFTGAVVPDGADSVVIQEQVQVVAKHVHLPATVKPKQHIREIGEDVGAGDRLLPAGKQITVADIGLLAAAGIGEVAVIRPLRVAFFSTGDELVPIGSALASGQIYDSNRYTLHALLQDACYGRTDLGVVPDDPTALEALLIKAADAHDVIISTGGASVGEADYVQRVLQRCGEVNFWKIAIKPGKPLAFGQIGGSYFFGLPGNPAAVLTTFTQVVKPGLQQLCGLPAGQAWRLRATSVHALKKSPGRIEFQRGVLSQNPAGDFEVRSTGGQGSHLLSTSSTANCYIVLSAECAGIQAGELVTVTPF